jgi:hypothetical protein
MSDLHWAVWGFRPARERQPRGDFWGYGLERLGAPRARMGGADFTHHLGVVRTGGLHSVARTPTHRPSIHPTTSQRSKNANLSGNLPS